LPDIRAARNSIGNGDAAHRSSTLARQDYGKLGTDLGSHDVHPDAAPVLPHAPAPRSRGGGLLADLLVLSRELVPGRLPRSRDQPLLLLFWSHRDCWGRVVFFVAWPRWARRAAWVAAAVPH